MDMPNLSFLPDDYLERKVQRRSNAFCGVLFLLVMGGVGWAFTTSERATKSVDAEFIRVDSQYVSEANRIQQVREMQEKQRRMAHQAELTASLLEKVPRRFILAEIANTMPVGVSLLEFSMDSKAQTKAAAPSAKTAYEQKKAARQPAASAAAAPQPFGPSPKVYDVNMKLTGVAYSDEQVAKYLSRLLRSRLLRDVNLVITEEYKLGEEKLRKFQIEMMLNPDADLSVMHERSQSQTTSVELKE